MKKMLLVILIILLIPVYLVIYISIHEMGHTTLARFLGDPDAVYYLIKIDQYSQAIGYTDYDISKLSWGANLAATLGGVLGTQVVASIAVYLLRLRQGDRLWRRILSIVAFTFAFDVPFQGMQALAHNGLERWPTGVDFIDVLLLLHMEFDVSQLLLKSLLLVAALLYVVGFVWIYRWNTMAQRLRGPSLEVA